tara:strand:+ start:129785 stop:130174 length:390 start_codon:yes stop_codon:yes gene_type:complete
MIREITDEDLAKELESNTVSLPNMIFGNFDTFNIYMEILGWYNNHGLRASIDLRKKWDKITELIGFAPIYYKNYNHKNAVWSLFWKNYPVLIYLDKRGIQIQVVPEFDREEILPFITELKNVLTTPTII